MNATITEIFKKWRVILLLVFLVFAYFSINGGLVPHFWQSGAVIRSVGYNSSAANAGVENPNPTVTPLARERLLSLNGQKITSAQDYYIFIDGQKGGRAVNAVTSKKTYALVTKSTDDGKVDLGLKVADAPQSNLRKGLDLEGGTRVLLKSVEPASKANLDTTVDSLKERLNVYGLSDVTVRVASDLAGNDFILIEIAGVTEQEVRDLLSKQGKFDAKIGNSTVFSGGKKDITYVCRSADCSGIDPRRGCAKSAAGYGCGFFFTITLSPEAAERQAAVTDKLSVITENGAGYLSESLVLYLDDKEVDSLKIGAELKGRASTNIQISGSGTGVSQQQAMQNTLANMKKLQTVLITGSLPVKLEVVQLDTVSPTLGKEFLQNIMLVGFIALLAVATIVWVRYRKWKIVIPTVLILLSEITLILGFAAFVGWNLDLAAIAGIIIVIGSGVNHLTIITDEIMRVHSVSAVDWKTKIKNALFIIMGAYLINISSLLPLFWVGAGLLKGFALTTIAGMSFGVLIARPAYAAIIETLMKE